VRGHIHNTLFSSELMNGPNKLECYIAQAMTITCSTVVTLDSYSQGLRFKSRRKVLVEGKGV
jgi:hypothetical protein